MVGGKFHRLPWVRAKLRHQYSCAGLFTGIERSWGQVAYLVRLEGATGWTEVPRDVVSPMPVAGFRQRLDRLMTDSRRSPLKGGIQDRIAAHVALRFSQAFPSEAKVAEVKLIDTRWRTDDPVMTQPVGRWRLPPADALDKKRYSVIGVWRRAGEGFERLDLAPVGDPASSNGTQTRRKLSEQLMQTQRVAPGLPQPPKPPSPVPATQPSPFQRPTLPQR